MLYDVRAGYFVITLLRCTAYIIVIYFFLIFNETCVLYLHFLKRVFSVLLLL